MRPSMPAGASGAGWFFANWAACATVTGIVAAALRWVGFFQGDGKSLIKKLPRLRVESVGEPQYRGRRPDASISDIGPRWAVGSCMGSGSSGLPLDSGLQRSGIGRHRFHRRSNRTELASDRRRSDDRRVGLARCLGHAGISLCPVRQLRLSATYRDPSSARAAGPGCRAPSWA